MKKLFTIMVFVLLAVSCGTIKDFSLQPNKIGSPFEEVKDKNVVFVEGYTTYPVGASDIVRRSKQAELENDLRGEFVKRITAKTETYAESRTSRASGEDEYTKDFTNWTFTSGTAELRADNTNVITYEVEKRGTIYCWIRIAGNRNAVLKANEKRNKAERKDFVNDLQDERRHEENMVKARGE